MNHKARQTIREYRMLQPGDTVIAAVSGGADSVALLDFLCSLWEYQLTIRACHLNHCLRGKESDRDEELVRSMCREYGVPLDVRRVEIRPLAGKRGTSIEVTARQERYAFFKELAQTYQAKVATAHTLSDTTETVLLNLSRGTGAAGLRGIPPVREGWVIRPLLDCCRQETEEYCHQHGLYFVTDSTNLTDDYTRNFLRHQVVPLLERVNPAFQQAVGRMSQQLRMDADCLDQLARQAASQCEVQEGGYDAQKLLELHPAVRGRILAGMLDRLGVEKNSQRVAMMEELLQGGRRRVLQVGGHQYIALRRGILRGEERRPARPLESLCFEKEKLDGLRLPLREGKAVSFSVIEAKDYEISENNTKVVFNNFLDYDKIDTNIFLRSRQPGDRMRPAGRGCSKPLRRLYSELALEGREGLLVLADSGGPFFAEGVGLDERVKPTPVSKRLLTILITEIIEREEDDHEKPEYAG